MRSVRSIEYGRRCFPHCASHAAAIADVHEILEVLAGSMLPNLDPDSSVSELLSGVSDGPTMRDDRASELLARALAASEVAEGGSQHSPRARDLASVLLRSAPEFAEEPRLSEFVLHTLLGPAAERCTWAGETVWSRSARGLANERMRLMATCTCPGSSHGRPTTR